MASRMKANVQGPLADLHAWRIFMANPHKQNHPMCEQSRPQLGVHQLETTSAAIDSAATMTTGLDDSLRGSPG